MKNKNNKTITLNIRLKLLKNTLNSLNKNDNSLYSKMIKQQYDNLRIKNISLKQKKILTIGDLNLLQI